MKPQSRNPQPDDEAQHAALKLAFVWAIGIAFTVLAILILTGCRS